MTSSYDIFVPSHDFLMLDGKRYLCQIGREGFASAEDAKREGDFMTPVGIYPLRFCLYRPDRVAMPETDLPVLAMEPDMGWCDAADDLLYNRLVRLPFAASHEVLWREDHCYDLLVVIGYNDAFVVPGAGSAIFMHLRHDDGRPTAGCVALAQKDMLTVLRQLRIESRIYLGPTALSAV